MKRLTEEEIFNLSKTDKLRYEILLKVIDTYTLKNRGIQGGSFNMCVYYDRETKNCCAVGMIVRDYTDMSVEKFSDLYNTIGSIDNIMNHLSNSGFDTEYPDLLMKLDYKFLEDLQTLHDTVGHWDSSGFNESKGTTVSFVNSLRPIPAIIIDAPS